MGDYFKRFKSFLGLQREFIANVHSENSFENLSNLSLISGIVFALSVILCSVASLFFSDWMFSLPYILLLFLEMFFFIWSRWYRSQMKNNRKLVDYMCFLFLCLLLLFCLIASIFAYPNETEVLFTAALVVMPAFFILPISWLANLTVIFAVIYCILASIYKPSFVARQDIFAIMLSTCCSFFILFMETRLRLTDYHVRIGAYDKNRRDTLCTDLLNQSAFETQCRAYISGKGHERCTFVLMGIDDAAKIQEEHGQVVSDCLMLTIASTLKNNTRTSDFVCRFTDGRFGIFFTDFCDTSLVQQRMKKIQSEIQMRGQEVAHVDAKCSAGLVFCATLRNRNYDGLYHAADDALYQAEETSNGEFVFSSVSDAI